MEWEAGASSVDITVNQLPTPDMPKNPQPHDGYIADYYRKSNPEKDKQVLSLGTQKRIADAAWETLPSEIRENRKRKEFEPESESAYKSLEKRTEYSKMIADAKEGKIFAVRAARFDRMVRNPEETGEFVQLMLDGIVRYFIATSTGRIYKHDCSDDIADLMREGGANTKFSMDLGVRVKEGMESKANLGGHVSGPVQFGFKPHRYFNEKGEEVHEVMQDGERYRWIMPLFVEASLGTSLRDLVKWAAAPERRITLRATPERPERPLSKTTIAGILHNPFYKGFRHFDGIVTEWTKQPPVPLELWERVQIIMSINYTSGARKKNPDLRQHFMFDRCVFCIKCGNQLNVYDKKIKSNGKLFVYYECKKAQPDGKTGCGTCIRQDRLKTQYEAKLGKAQVPEVAVAELRIKLMGLHEEKMRSRTADLDYWNEKYQEKETAITEQVKALPKSLALGFGHITEGEIEKLKAEREQIKQQLDASHVETTNWIDKVVRSYELLHLVQEAINHGSPKVRAAMLKAVTTNFDVDGKKLICKLRSPFHEASLRDECPEWWAILDSNQRPPQCQCGALTS